MNIEPWRVSIEKKFKEWRKKAEEAAEEAGMPGPSAKLIRAAKAIQVVLDNDTPVGEIRPLEVRLAQAALDSLSDTE